MNAKQQGSICVAKAIAYFTEKGYVVSIPISEVQRYDLVVEMNGELKRVEVKSTGYKRSSGSYQVQLATYGGVKTGKSTIKAISRVDCDLVFICVEDGTLYLFPIEVLDGIKTNFTLSSKYNLYKV